MMLWQQLVKWAAGFCGSSQRPAARIIYPVIFLAVFIRMGARFVQQAQQMRFDHFQDISLWGGFLGVLFFHLMLLFLSASSEKLKGHPPPFIYFGLLLTFYFAVLVNHCFLRFPDNVLLFSVLAGIFIFLYPYKINVPRPQWQWEDILIALWFLNSLLFFLEYNFDAQRTMYIDERSFWYAAAQNMLKEGTLKAHMMSYPGGGLHPYGLPLISALPLLIFQFIPMGAIYFMPVIILLTLGVFLWRIKKDPWAFLFFLTALFCTFNNRSWVASLFYQFGYGEGISTVIFLWVTVTISAGPGRLNCFLVSFFMGLLALTKSPLSVTVLPFLAVFFYKNRGQISWGAYPVCLMLAVIPSAVWKFFLTKHEISYREVSVGIYEMLTRLPNPNVEFISRAIQVTHENADNLMYFGILSVVFWFLFERKAIEGIPALFLLAGVCSYYSYYYVYGMPGEGDSGSFLRYIMPVSLALYYLGARGFSHLWERLETGRFSFPLKLMMGVLLTGLFVHKWF